MNIYSLEKKLYLRNIQKKKRRDFRRDIKDIWIFVLLNIFKVINICSISFESKFRIPAHPQNKTDKIKKKRVVTYVI